MILPFEGSSSKASKCSKDDFPEPDGPTKATKSPSFIFKFILLKRVRFHLSVQNFSLSL